MELSNNTHISVKTNAKLMNSYIARMASIWEPALDSKQSVPAIAMASFGKAFIVYGDAESKYRPALMLIGRVRSIKGEFFDRVREMEFGNDDMNWPEIHCRYEFGDDQLMEMIEKGFYHDNYEVPKLFTNDGVEFELPVICDYNILRPEKEGDVPVPFVRIKDAFEIEITERTSGYRLADYFKEVEAEAERKGPKLTYVEFDDYTPEPEDILEQEQQEAFLSPEIPNLWELEDESERAKLQRALHSVESRVDRKLLETEGDKAFDFLAKASDFDLSQAYPGLKSESEPIKERPDFESDEDDIILEPGTAFEYDGEIYYTGDLIYEDLDSEDQLDEEEDYEFDEAGFIDFGDEEDLMEKEEAEEKERQKIQQAQDLLEQAQRDETLKEVPEFEERDEPEDESPDMDY